jgi:hypothetical protein
MQDVSPSLAARIPLPTFNEMNANLYGCRKEYFDANNQQPF